MSYGEADRIAKLIPGFPLNITLDESLEKSPALAEQVKREPRVGELWSVAKALEGCTRHASVHASAVVISDEPLMERVPLYKDPKRPELITGLAMGPIEKLGLLKMDFLGLKTLTVITDAVRLINDARGIDARRGPSPARRRARPTSSSPRRAPSACSSWSRRGCAMPSGGSGPSASRTSSPWSRSIGRGRWT